MSNNTFVKEISPRAWVAGTSKVAAVITQTDLDVQSDVGDYTQSKGTKKRIMGWGANNSLPEEREVMIRSSNVVPELIATKRDMTLGQGLFAYKKRIDVDPKERRQKMLRDEVEMPTKAKEFFERVDIEKENIIGAGEIFKHENLFTQFVCKKGVRLGYGKGEIESMQTKLCRHVRAEEQNKRGMIENFHWYGFWGKKTRKNRKDKHNTKPIPVPAFERNRTIPQANFMLHSYDPLLFDDYYAHPRYWGAKTWMSLANAIPLFHLNNLENGYNVRFHIEIPADYFNDSTVTYETEEQKEEAAKNEKSARQNFIDTVNEFLAGIENAGRALFTTFDYNAALNKIYPGIKITPIDFDMKDEALIKLFGASNTATISSMGVPPTLASIETQGKLSSGSEKRNDYLMFLATKTPTPRRLLLERINLAKKIEGWDEDVFYGFRDVEIVKLDEEKSGKRDNNENNG